MKSEIGKLLVVIVICFTPYVMWGLYTGVWW